MKRFVLVGILLLVVLASCRAQPASTAVRTEGEPDAYEKVVLPDEATLDEMGRLSRCGEVERPQEAPEGIVVTLELDRETYAPGDPVKMTLTLRHIGDEPVYAWWSHLTEHLTEVDLWVQEGDQVIWRRGYRKVFLLETPEEDIPPGEVRVKDYVWNQEVCQPDEMEPEVYLEGPLSKGRYVARGIWHRSQQKGVPRGWWSQEVPFQIR